MPLTNKDILELRQRKAYDASKPREPKLAPWYHHREHIVSAECCATCRFWFMDSEDMKHRCAMRTYEVHDGFDYVETRAHGLCSCYDANEWACGHVCGGKE